MEDEGDVATAFTMSRILSNIPISRGGPTSLVIFDIHALQVREGGVWSECIHLVGVVIFDICVGQAGNSVGVVVQ